MDFRHLLIVPLLVGSTLTAPAPHFAYSTTTYHQPYVPVPVPFARQVYPDIYSNQVDRSVPERAEAPPPPSPYPFIPATLPLAIYSEPSHILSGYSYQTLDPAGAKSQVLFVSGPNTQQLFRHNADLLNIVLPPLFTGSADGLNFFPGGVVPAWGAGAGVGAGVGAGAGDSAGATKPEQTDNEPAAPEDPATNPAPAPATDPAPSSEEPSSGSETSATGAIEPKTEGESDSKESRTDEDNTSQENVKPTDIPAEKKDEDTSKEEPDKSAENEGVTSIPAVKDDGFKIDVSTSEASNSVKTVPLEADSSEAGSTEIPSTSEKSDSQSENKSDEVKSDKSDGLTTQSSVAETTIASAE